ncbi:transglycosylase SLT domain-containing protein [Nocardia sp. NPDC051463]|uniref:transglycosylase SLT domain-containing protein n=1 Tax=Nocardia sp. NPDC051463 TaxID=3154845 RepID=UPI00344C25C4
MPDYRAGSASVEIKPNFDGFVRQLRRDLDRVEADLGVEINPDISGFSRALDSELQRVTARLDVEINPDLTGFSAELQSGLQRINATIDVNIRPDFDRREFEAVLATYRPTVFANIVPALDQSAFAAVEELLNRLARDRTANIRANTSGLGGVGRQADSAHRSLTAMSAVKFTGLAAGITALVPILLGAAGAAGGLLAVFGALGGVGAIGGSGIIGAFSAMKDATAGAGQAAQDHARDLDQVADAQQRVIDAQHNEMDSLQRVEDAQKSLTQAREDAKDAVDNLNLAVKNGQLSEKGAELAYRRAVVNLQKVKRQAAQGKASGLDVESAQFEVEQAGQNITNVRVRNAQTGRDANEANAKGIEGSDQVVAAKRQLEQAQYGVAQAQIQTAQAVRDLARAQEDAAKSGLAAAGGTDKFAEALAKLAPSARDFVLQMQALGPAWKDLRLAVQENLFAGLGDSVTQFANSQLPELKNGLSQLATGMNGAFKDTLSSLDALFTGLVNNGTMQAFIDGVNQAMQGMAPFVTGLTSAFIQLGAAVGPHLGPFFAALGTTLDKIAGPLGQIGGVFLDTLTNLMPTLTALISALSTGLAPVLPVVGRLLDSIGRALIPLIPPISQIASIVGNALADAVNALAPYLPVIAKAFADVLAAVAPLVGPLAQIVGILAGAIAQNISALAQALAPVVTQLANGLQPVIPILIDAFAKLTPVFAQVAQILGEALGQALTAIMPVLPELVQAWADMAIALAPLLPPLAELGAQILPILAEILVQIAPYLVDLLKVFTSFVNFVVQLAVPAIQNMAETMDWAWEHIKGAWDGMKIGLDQLKDKFSTIVEAIKSLWKSLVEVFKSGGLGGIAGAVVDKALDLIPGLPGHADGGVITGAGSGTSDSIVARLSNGEFVVNAASTARALPLLEAINNNQLPGFASGGIVDSMAAVVGSKFPGMKLTSGLRNTDNGYHSVGKAADFSNGSDDTPEMQALASFIASNYPQSLELIHAPFGHNIKNGKDVGDGVSTYGAATMGQHRNHVHWAIGAPITAPSAPNAPGGTSPQADPSNYSPTGTYVGPSSADTSKDALQSDDGLPQEYSLQGIFSKAGTILADGVLGFFGMQNSVLSSNNVYNKALTTTIDYYSKKGQENTTAAPESGVAPETAAPATPEAPASTKHTYVPGGGAEQWRSTVMTVLQATGRDAGLTDRTLSQIGIESGGNPDAINNTDINAVNGTPSIGLLQVIKPTFDAYADARFPGTQKDPEPNIAAALNYVDKRYGGAAKIWPTTAGYAAGGWVFGAGSSTSDSIPARLSHGEFVVNAASAAANSDWLQAINSGSPQTPTLPPGFGVRGGDVRSTRDHSMHFHGDTNVMNPQDFIDAVDRHQSKQSIGLSAALP